MRSIPIKKITSIFFLLGFWLFVTGGGFGKGWPGLAKYCILAVLIAISLRAFILNIGRNIPALLLLLAFISSRYFVQGDLERNDVLVSFYALFFLIIYRGAKPLSIKSNFLVAIILVQFFINLFYYNEWQIENSAIRFKLSYTGEEIDPNLSAICCVFASMAVVSITDSRLMKVILAIVAIATCLIFESRSATLLLLTYWIMCAFEKKLLIRSLLALFVLVGVVFMCVTVAEKFNLNLPPRILNVAERFQPDNLKSEEEAEGARFEIYTDISRCLERYESIYSGCEMSSQKNPHNEYVRGYVDAGLLGLAVVFAALFSSFFTARPMNKNLLIAGYVPMAFYGFTFYLFSPIFFTMLLFGSGSRAKKM